MLKKGLSILLVFVIFSSMGMTAFAATPVAISENSVILNSGATNEREGMVLIGTEVSVVDDGEGHEIEMTIKEYGEPGDVSLLEQSQSDVKLMSGYIPDYEVGHRRSFEFTISNDAIGFPSLAAGTPLTSKMKKAIAKAIAKKMSEKVAAQFIPGVNVASWVLAAIAYGNSKAGNDGFEVVIDCIYAETYLHKEGYYMYGWDIEDCTFGVY